MTAKSLLHAELDLFPTSSNVIISTQIHCVKMCLYKKMDQATSNLSLSEYDKPVLIQTFEKGGTLKKKNLFQIVVQCEEFQQQDHLKEVFSLLWS